MRTLFIGLLGLGLCMGTSTRASILVDFENTTEAPYTDFIWGGWGAVENGYVIGAQNAAVARVDGLAFSFEGADFASEGNTTLAVSGWRNGVQVSSQTFNIQGVGFVSFPSTIVGVDKLVFSAGPVVNWKMDNFLDTVAVPEPATMMAGALLLLPFGVSTLRKLRRV